MPRNGSGAYSAPASTWNPPVPGVTMSSADWNQLLSDLCQAISNSIAIDGQSATSNPIPFAQGIYLSAGTPAAPSLAAINDAASGFYFPAVGQIGLSAGGVAVLTATSTGVTIPLGAVLNGNAQVGGAGSKIGFYGSAGAVQPPVAGSWSGGTAGPALAAALASLGLIVNNTSA